MCGGGTDLVGPFGNQAIGDYSSVSGGQGSISSGDFSSVSGGQNRPAVSFFDWAAGTFFEDF